MDWYIEVLKKYADFNGRASRREFWMFTLFNTIFSVVLRVVDALIFVKLLQIHLSPLSSLYSILFLVPTLAVSIRRLHDRDLSGFHILIGLIPLAGGLILLILFAQEGSKADNRYGGNPKLTAF